MPESRQALNDWPYAPVINVEKRVVATTYATTFCPWGFQIPFPAFFASISRSFFLLSSSDASRLISLSLAHPFLRSSDAKSTPPISAVPRSRGMSSLVGNECMEVKDISLPTASWRRNSRDSNAHGCNLNERCNGAWLLDCDGPHLL